MLFRSPERDLASSSRPWRSAAASTSRSRAAAVAGASTPPAAASSAAKVDRAAAEAIRLPYPRMARSPVRRRIRATGRVQGVFFRDSTREEAERRGVAGWVRNCADGSVEAVFEGEPGPVEALVEACRRGPGHASVSRLEVSDEAVEGLDGFDVC